MGPRFDETMRGRKFYDADLPRLIKAIEANTAEMKRANDLKEKEMKTYEIKLFKGLEVVDHGGEPTPDK